MTASTFSLNRLEVGDTIAGRLLSKRPLVDLMAYFSGLPIEHLQPTMLDDWASGANRDLAEGVAVEYGRRMAGLLVALQDTVWRKITYVGIGGGLMNGFLGRRSIAVASQHQSFFRIERFAYPLYMTIIGAARTAPSGTRDGLLLDFGGTAIKRARARYDRQKLVQIETLPTQPAQHLLYSDRADEVMADDIWRLFDFIADTIATSWQGETFIGLSIATHMKNEQPISATGYGYLRLLETDVLSLLRQRVCEKLDHQIQLNWYHDGTAAAAALPSHRAAITFGTAIGGAIRPTTLPLWDLDEKFEVF